VVIHKIQEQLSTVLSTGPLERKGEIIHRFTSEIRTFETLIILIILVSLFIGLLPLFRLRWLPRYMILDHQQG
jgi:hypothetical protein